MRWCKVCISVFTLLSLLSAAVAYAEQCSEGFWWNRAAPSEQECVPVRPPGVSLPSDSVLPRTAQNRRGAPRSWCLWMKDQWESIKNKTGIDDKVKRASIEDGNCAYHGVMLPEPTPAAPTTTPRPESQPPGGRSAGCSVAQVRTMIQQGLTDAAIEQYCSSR
jgi:hypothetical protein